MKLKIKKTSPLAVIPHYATEHSAGFDLTAISSEIIDNSDRTKFGFGLAFEIPVGYVGLLFPRSSIHKTSHAMSNCVGVIDSDYRGEVSAIFDTVRDGVQYRRNERLAQMVIVPFEHVDFEEVEELSDTVRGDGGYGHSGK